MALVTTRRSLWLSLFLVLVLTAAACGGGGDGADPTEPEGQEGGEYAMSICEPEHLIPTNTNETCGSQVLQTLFSQLVEYDAETSEPRNLIAESMESEDQQTWTITLNDGWTFHDGSDVTAQSFVDAWNYGAYGPNAQGNSYFFENIEGYDDLQCPDVTAEGECKGEPTSQEMSGLVVEDDLTFTVTLKAPFSQFPLTVGYNAFSPLPEVFFDDPEAFEQAPVGNGAYQIVDEWKHDEEIVVERYEDYAGDPGNADRIRFAIYSSLETAYRDLQAGNIDIVDSIPPEQLEAARQEFGDRFIERESSSFTYIGFPLYLKDFQNPDLRKAFSMAIDRQAIIDAIFFGSFQPAKSVVSPVVAGSREDACVESCDYDPEAAKELLDQAGGWPANKPLTLWFNSDGGHEEWMEAVKNQLSQNLGIENIKFESLEFADYLGRLDEEKITGPFRLGWVMDYPSPQNYLEPIYSTTGSSNNFGYSNEEVDDLIEQGNQAASIDEGIEFYQQAEDIILDEMPSIPMWFGKTQTAHTERIDNVIIDAFSFLRATDVEVVEE